MVQDLGLLLLKKMPHIQKNIIHVDRSKFDGSMMYLPFHFCFSIISIQLQVGPVIICLVVGVVACLKDKWGDLIGLEKVCAPFNEVVVMANKE